MIVNKSARCTDIFSSEKLAEMQTLLEENIIADDHIEAKITMMHIKNLAPNFNLVQLLGDSLYDRAMAL